jgi:hypothetical protein
MRLKDLLSQLILAIIAILLGVIASKLQLDRPLPVRADTGRFDYVQVLAAPYLYNGNQGVLLLDKRNGNVWFISKVQDMTMKKTSFKDPVFIVRVPLEKLDEQAQ